MRRGLTLPAVVVSLIALACAPGEQASLADQNRAHFQRFFDEFDADLSVGVFDQWLTDDFVSHAAGAAEPTDLATYRDEIAGYLGGFTEIRHVIREMVAEGDRVAALIDISMRHSGEFAGVPATNRTVHVSEMLIFRFRDGRIAEEWIMFDGAGLMQQIQEPASQP